MKNEICRIQFHSTEMSGKVVLWEILMKNNVTYNFETECPVEKWNSMPNIKFWGIQHFTWKIKGYKLPANGANNVEPTKSSEMGCVWCQSAKDKRIHHSRKKEEKQKATLFGVLKNQALKEKWGAVHGSGFKSPCYSFRKPKFRLQLPYGAPDYCL